MRIIESNKTYRHYGSDKYNRDIKVDLSYKKLTLSKPKKAALWGTPIESDFGWKDWCEREDFDLDSLKTYFDFKLRPGSKVLIIENEQDLDGLDEFIHHDEYANDIGHDDLILMIFGYRRAEQVLLNWEKLVSIVDAVEILYNDFTCYRFYGWDCDSICVLNPDAIEEVK